MIEKPCVVEDIEIYNGNLTENVGSLVPSGHELVNCYSRYSLVNDSKPVCQNGEIIKPDSVLHACKLSWFCKLRSIVFQLLICVS